MCQEEGKQWLGSVGRSQQRKVTLAGVAALEHKQPLQWAVPLTIPDFLSHPGGVTTMGDTPGYASVYGGVHNRVLSYLGNLLG